VLRSRDRKRDGVRLRGSVVLKGAASACAPGLVTTMAPIAVHELPAIFGVAETFGKWKGRCEPRDCFGHVGVVEHGYHGAVWCRAVLLEH
jgi:hypothetical protein